jgi:hypothetical protein
MGCTFGAIIRMAVGGILAGASALLHMILVHGVRHLWAARRDG